MQGRTAKLSALELKVPPPLAGLLAAALMWLVSRLAPAFAFTLPGRGVLVGALVSIGVLLDLAALVSFRRARTTVDPMRPADSAALVTSGIYRFTRNPMYLGLVVLLAAWGTWLANVLSLACIAGFVVWMNRFQIEPEERVLAGLFGHDYAVYRARVRRWL